MASVTPSVSDGPNSPFKSEPSTSNPTTRAARPSLPSGNPFGRQLGRPPLGNSFESPSGSANPKHPFRSMTRVPKEPFRSHPEAQPNAPSKPPSKPPSE